MKIHEPNKNLVTLNRNSKLGIAFIKRESVLFRMETSLDVILFSVTL